MEETDFEDSVDESDYDDSGDGMDDFEEDDTTMEETEEISYEKLRICNQTKIISIIFHFGNFLFHHMVLLLLFYVNLEFT